MHTSHFANLKKITAPYEPVAIAVGVPGWYKGKRELRLAPTQAMLKMSKPDYDKLFFAQLEKLDAKALFADLGDNAVLLCWEKPGEWCHRRAAAEWFERELGIIVPEFGLERSTCCAYDSMQAAAAKPRAKRARASKPAVTIPTLFG